MPPLLPFIIQQRAGTPAAGWNRRIGSEVVEAHGGCQAMAERGEAIRDLGREDEHSQVMRSRGAPAYGPWTVYT